MGSLAQFYDQQIITDVLAAIKGGKEASVYRCAAPGHRRGARGGEGLPPAHVPPASNDKQYRQAGPS